jgi:REP element-mobilizing transposase RayT
VTRPPRVHVPDGFYHLILRGNNRRDIYLDERDRVEWESWVMRGLERTGVRLHAFCWMSNHVHMLAQPDQTPLGEFVREAATHYARWFNVRRQRTGHLFERRHRAIFVEDDIYLLQLVRYIHLNPVVAGVCRNAADYCWSSHRQYLGLERRSWLTTSFVLDCFGASSAAAEREYRRFMDVSESEIEPEAAGGDEGLGLTPRHCNRVPKPGGKQPDRSKTASVAALQDQTDAAALIERLCRQHGLTIAELRCLRTHAASRLRASIAAEVYRHGGVSISEIARLLGRDQSVMSRAIRNRIRV